MGEVMFLGVDTQLPARLAMTREQHIRSWSGCKRCTIGTLACRHVFFRGDLPCKLLFVGEGPGRTEDKEGVPFIGASGRLLDILVSQAMPPKLKWAVTNTVACRPTDKPDGPNRQPSSQEIENCRGRFFEALIIAKPEWIILLGRVAFTAYHNTLARFYPVLTIPHPAFFCRIGGEKSTGFKKVVKRVQTWVHSLS